MISVSENFIAILALCNFFVFSKEVLGEHPKISLQVYYESLCPDSIRFITGQLEPSYERLGKYLNVDLIPFGKASYKAKKDGGWTFTCQHGPKECQGNMYQACLLNKLNGNQDLQVKAVTCIMAAPQPNEATLECMSRLSITSPSFSEVETCATSVEGERLLYLNGKETKNLKPDLYFVPWITFKRVWSKPLMESALKNLTATLCSEELRSVPECQ